MLRVELLGGVRAWLGERELHLGPARQRAVLAVLALRPGRTVPRAELISAIWGDDRPATVDRSVYTYVSGLRKALGADQGLLIGEAGGYRLDIPESAVDALVFQRHCAQARTAVELAHAEALWRGVPLSGIPGPLAPRERDRLTGLWVDLLADRAELLLAEGRNADAVADLTAQIDAHPLRERLRGLLMLAQYRSGRQAEAVRAFQDTRRTLLAELGVEPGAPLRELHQRILAGDPELAAPDPAAPAPGPAPAQLPQVTPGFCGRRTELAELSGLFGRRPVPSAVLIEGSGGVGKTTLAVRLAHQLREHFPDGQLFLDLRGFDPVQQPLPPTEVLAQVLRGLGMAPEELPRELPPLRELYRDALAGRRMLVLADNARSAGQLLPLLPETAGCLVLATSRNHLPQLAALGVRALELDVLGPAEALELLTRLLGADRVAAEPSATAELQRLCGGLPLAVRVAGERAGLHPTRSLAELVGELSDVRDRLDALSIEDEDVAVRSVFSWSYSALSEEPARLFRLLGLHPGPEFAAAATAALTGLPPGAAGALLDTLARAHLVRPLGQDRYRMHDLVRLYALELAEREDPAAARAAAVRRLLEWYLATAAAAGPLLRPDRRCAQVDLAAPVPGFPGRAAALAWLSAEEDNLVAAVGQAAAAGHHDLAAVLPTVMSPYLHLTKLWTRWLPAHDTAVASAQVVGDTFSEGWLLNDLALAHGRRQEYAEAEKLLIRSLYLRQLAGDHYGAAGTLGNLGMLHHEQGRLPDAVELARRTLAAFTELGSRSEMMVSHSNLGLYLVRQGDFAEARQHLQHALELATSLGNQPHEAIVMDNFGDLHRAQGDPAAALRWYREALPRHRAAADHWRESLVRKSIGAVLAGLGDHPAALAELRAAREGLAEVDEPAVREIDELVAAITGR